MRILLTGASGFIGCNIVNILDGDVVPITRGASVPSGDFDVVIHAAGKHRAPDEEVIKDNMVYTQEMLKLAKERNVKMFIFLSSNEVFGPGLTIKSEESPYNCPTVYSAAKAGAEQLCIASGLPVTILRLVNVYGPSMQKWKFLPTCTRQIMNNELVTIHPGQRSWVHVFDVGDAINFVIKNSKLGKFNIVGQTICNMDLAQSLAQSIGKTLRWQMVGGGAGHEAEYPVTGAALGWTYSRNISDHPHFTKFTNHQWDADFHTHPASAPLCGVFIETRVHPRNAYALRNFSHMLPNAALTIFHSAENEAHIREIIGPDTNIRLITFPVVPFVYAEYENFLKSPYFWSNFLEFDRIIMFMNDTGIRKNSILEFMKYDYIGAPWDHFPIGDPRVFQGGGAFSLRNPSLMHRITLENPAPPGFPEDVYFSASTVSRGGTCVPATKQQAARFSSDALAEHPDPMGFHNCFDTLPVSYTMYEDYEEGPRVLVNVRKAMVGSRDVTALVRLGVGPRGLWLPAGLDFEAGSVLVINDVHVELDNGRVKRSMRLLNI